MMILHTKHDNFTHKHDGFTSLIFYGEMVNFY